MMLPGSTALTVMPYLRELDAGGAHEAELAGLGGAVVGPAGKAGHRAGDRGGEDDAALAGSSSDTGRQAFTDRKVPLRLVPMTWSHSSGIISSIFACGKMPALAHRMSMPPKASAVAFGHGLHAAPSR